MTATTRSKGLICPRCDTRFYERPVLCRHDNKSYICSDCGTREALESVPGNEYKGGVYWEEKRYCDWCGDSYQPEHIDQIVCIES